MNGLQSLILQAVELSGVGIYDFNGSNLPASYRGDDDPTYSNDYVGFRPALYVKL